MTLQARKNSKTLGGNNNVPKEKKKIIHRTPAFESVEARKIFREANRPP